MKKKKTTTVYAFILFWYSSIVLMTKPFQTIVFIRTIGLQNDFGGGYFGWTTVGRIYDRNLL